ncbi:MAG TPA: alpha/beta hydrolase, partial [Burkholderiaceae bacterium]
YHLVQVHGFAGTPVGGNSAGPVAAPVAEELSRYIASEGLKQPAVIGHSMGGTMGLMLSARHPEQVSRLMVVDMMPFVGAMFGGPGTTAESIKPRAEAIVAGMRAQDAAARQKRIEGTIAGMVDNEAMRPAALEDSLKSDAEVSSRSYYEIIVTDLTPELARITAPVSVLFVVPKGVPLTQEQMSGFYKAAYAPIKSVKTQYFPQAAHFLMWDQPAKFQVEVKAFLTAK